MEHQEIIDSLTSEKLALDKAYVNEIKTCLELRKQHEMKDKYIEGLNAQIQKLLEENKLLTEERDNLRSSMNVLASDAQSTEG